MSDPGLRALLNDPATRILIVLYVEAICGVVAAGIAQDRGRRAWPAFLLGFFASVFGVLAVALSDVERELGDLTSFAERWSRRLGWSIIIAAGTIAYSNSFTAPFVFDGANYLLENEKIRVLEPESLADVWRDKERWEKFLGFAQTRVTTYFTFALDHRYYRYEVVFWHRTSLIIHIVGALALYGIARRALSSPRFQGRFDGSFERLALAIAVLWVVHPVNTQSVTYLYQRLEALMGMFYFLTIYLCGRMSRAESWKHVLPWGALSVSCCALGMASKEVMVTAPLLTLWFDRVFCAAGWGELMRRRGRFYVALFSTLSVSTPLIWKTFTHKTENYAVSGIADPARISPQEYAFSQLGVVKHYLKIAVVPTALNIDHAWPKAIDWPQWPDREWPFLHSRPSDMHWDRLWIPGVVVGGLVLLWMWAIYFKPPLGFLGAGFFIVLAPTSSFVPIVDLCFEHRTYVPLAAVVAAVVLLGDSVLRVASRRLRLLSPTVGAWIGAVMVVAAAGMLTYRTMDRNLDYQSELSLWRVTAEKAPNNQRAQYNYGVYLQRTANEQADKEEAERHIQLALEQYDKTLKLDPMYMDAHWTIARLRHYRAVVYQQAGKHDLAKFEFEKALEAYRFLSGYQVAEYSEVVQRVAEIYYKLGTSAEEYVRLGLVESGYRQRMFLEAQPWYIAAQQQDLPAADRIAQLHQLTSLECEIGAYSSAQAHVSRLLELQPDHAGGLELKSKIEAARSPWQIPTDRPLQ